MRDLAVVALEEVLAADLPVRGVFVAARALEEPQRVEIDPRGGDEGGQLAERLRERLRLLVGVDEDERAPGVDRDGDEAEHVLVEVRTRSERGAARNEPSRP